MDAVSADVLGGLPVPLKRSIGSQNVQDVKGVNGVKGKAGGPQGTPGPDGWRPQSQEGPSEAGMSKMLKVLTMS